MIGAERAPRMYNALAKKTTAGATRQVTFLASLCLLFVACGSDTGSNSSVQTRELEAGDTHDSNAGGRDHAADEAQLKRLEHDYARALLTKDYDFLNRYYAVDWRGGNWMGFWTKPTMLNAIMSEHYIVKEMKLRDLTVRVIGDVGIVQGVDEEITSVDGRDTSGKWAFTDVFARREGRWVAVASHTSEVRPNEP